MGEFANDLEYVNLHFRGTSKASSEAARSTRGFMSMVLVWGVGFYPRLCFVPNCILGREYRGG